MRTGIKQKLLLIYLVVILPLTLLIGYNYYNFYLDQKNDAMTAHHNDAKQAAASFDRLINETVETNMSVGSAIQAQGMSGSLANGFLQAVQRRLPFGNLYYLNDQGKVTVSVVPAMLGADGSESPLFQKMASGNADWTVTRFQKNADGEYGFAVLTAIRNSDGRLYGVVGTAIDGKDLQRVVPRELLKGSVTLTDANGEVIYDTAVPNMGLSERAWGKLEPVQQALKGIGYASGSMTLPGHDGSYVGSVVPVSSTGWTAGYFTPTDEAFAQAKSAALLSLLVILAVIGISTALGLVYIRKISKPIINLADRSIEIGQGNFDQLVEVHTGDELELLTNNFNRMQESLKRNFEDLNALFEASRAVNSALDVGSVTETAAEYLRTVFQAGVVVIRTVDQETGQSSIIYAGELSRDEAEEITRAADAFLGSAAKDIETVSYYNLVEYGPPQQAFERAGAKALVSLPLVTNDELIGRIDALITEGTDSKLGRNAMGLAVSFAQQVSVAIENAQLHERQRYIADVLQDSLLTSPQEMPGLDVGLAYHPATTGAKVGGDFYDFIRFDDDSVAVVVGDISGRGIEAARHTALAKNAVRSFASEDPSPAKVIERVNKIICGESDSFRFITLFYALIDHKTSEVRYAGGGHPPALFFDQAGDNVNELASRGL
ncbi:MAG: SpoIIE family protein phosphatase, partial [Chloroflexi bacterium]|nr:SpoIIE family protein phosphatase [Chloroflexota bacterium]